MFTSNVVVDIYREAIAPDVINGAEEYDVATESTEYLVYRGVPIHLTLVKISARNSSGGFEQYVSYLARCRKNVVVQQGDRLISPTGRVFAVDSVDDIPSSFINNTLGLYLSEVSAGKF